MAKLKQDFTVGNIGRHLYRFCLPFLLSNLLQALYGACDLAIVGRFCEGSSAAAGVAIGSQITHLATMAVSGLTIGGTILVAQYFSARQEKNVSETIGTMFSLLFFVALGMTALGIAFCDPLLRLLQTPPSAFAQARSYLRICMSGIVFIFGYNAISAVQRGMGDSLRPLIFVAVACAVNIGLDLLLVAGFQMGAAGAAIATIAAQALSLLLAAWYLKRSGFVFDFSLKSFTPSRHKVKMLLSIGLPSSLQSIVVNISFLLMTAIVNGFQAEAATAAVGFAGKFNSFAILPTVAMSSSVSSIAAQNIAANRLDRARTTMVRGMQISFAWGLAVFALARLAPEWVLRLFTADEAAIAWGVPYLKMYGFDYLIVPFVFCMNGLINASGHTLYSMATAITSSIALRMPFAFLLSRTALGISGVGLAASLASLCSVALCAFFVLSGRWKRNRTGIQRLGEERS